MSRQSRTFFLVFNLIAQCRRDLCKHNPVENAKPNQPGRNARRDIRINAPLHIWRIPNHGDDEYIEHNVESNKTIDHVSGFEDQRLPFRPSTVQVKGGKTNRNGGFSRVSFSSKITVGVLTGNPGLSICPEVGYKGICRACLGSVCTWNMLWNTHHRRSRG